MREGAAESSQEATRLGGAAADAERALAEMTERLKNSTGSDPDTARAIADATEHARSLIAALGVAHRGSAPRALARRAPCRSSSRSSRLLADDEEQE